MTLITTPLISYYHIIRMLSMDWDNHRNIGIINAIIMSNNHILFPYILIEKMQTSDTIEICIHSKIKLLN